jgi:hypothetical protein
MSDFFSFEVIRHSFKSADWSLIMRCDNPLIARLGHQRQDVAKNADLTAG